MLIFSKNIYLLLFKKSTTTKYTLAIIVGSLLYCEWFIYLAQPRYWHRLKCQSDDESCTRILFVADPQIQGDEAEVPPMRWLYNWDSDRYLSTTFSTALNSFQPHVVIYMGDLMDEGSIATREQYHQYVKRLSNIFEIDYHVVQVWLPGDNDIGGEYEPVRKDKVEEFENVFQQSSIVNYKNISFYKVNGITRTFPSKEDSDNNFKIVVSHYPITKKHVFGNMVNNKIHPNIYFAAHEHESKYVKQNKKLQQRETHNLDRGHILDISFEGDSLYEIQVPTCSYRMGTDKMGYGAAVLDNNNKRMRYSVYWSPRRFPILFFYLGMWVFMTVACVMYVYLFCQDSRIWTIKRVRKPLLP